MVARGKGILAADESGRHHQEALRWASSWSRPRSIAAPYREMLFTAPGAAESVSGVILYDETIRQKTRDGTPFPQYLVKQGNHPRYQGGPGCEAARGFQRRDHHRGTRRLARAAQRLPRARRARFAKWRAVIDIAEGIPTAFAVEANAHALARYAARCQENDIVPIVEPEVLMDGAHSRSSAVSR